MTEKSNLGPLSSPEENDPDQFLNKAKRLVRDEVAKNHHGKTPEIYIVWFSKVLQNWKALLSTNLPDGKYYEVTYNGDKREAYVDTYRKESNVAIPDKDVHPAPEKPENEDLPGSGPKVIINNSESNQIVQVERPDARDWAIRGPLGFNDFSD